MALEVAVLASSLADHLAPVAALLGIRRLQRIGEGLEAQLVRLALLHRVDLAAARAEPVAAQPGRALFVEADGAATVAAATRQNDTATVDRLFEEQGVAGRREAVIEQGGAAGDGLPGLKREARALE